MFNAVNMPKEKPQSLIERLIDILPTKDNGGTPNFDKNIIAAKIKSRQSLLDEIKKIYNMIIIKHFTPLSMDKTSMVTESSCFHGYLYQLMYPICWFRSFAFMLFMNPSMRDILLHNLNYTPDYKWLDADTVLKDKPYTEQLITDYLLNMISYVQKGVFRKRRPEKVEDYDPGTIYSISANYYKGLHYISKAIECTAAAEDGTGGRYIVFDDVLLLFMALLNDYDPIAFWVSNVNGGFGDSYCVNFCNKVLPGIVKDKNPLHILHTMGRNEDIIINIKPKKCHPANVQFVLVHNKLSVSSVAFNPRGQQTCFFVRHNGHVYSLSSMIMTTIFNWHTIRNCGHQFCIFRCNGKFFSEYKNRSTDVLPYIIHERKIIEYVLLNQLLPDQMFNEFDYSFRDSIRLGAYTKDMFPLTEDECSLLYEFSKTVQQNDEYPSWMASKLGSCFKPSSKTCSHMLRLLAILSYFTKSITVDIYAKPPRTTNKNQIAPEAKPAKTYKFWNHYRSFENILGFHLIANGPRVDLGDMTYDILSPPFPNELANRWEEMILETDYAAELASRDHMFKIKSFIPRNMIQTELLQSIFEMLNIYVSTNAQPAASGGEIKQKIRILKTKKVYKVKTTSKSQKYIMKNATRTPLSSIKGTYRYV